MDDSEFGSGRTGACRTAPRYRDTLVVSEHSDGAHVELEVLHAPPQACISGELLEWLEYSPWGGARFDGDVLAIHARNGRFCYRVDRRPLLRWMATADGWAPPADYLMHRIDEVP